jgi:rare lipoprotein A
MKYVIALVISLVLGLCFAAQAAAGERMLASTYGEHEAGKRMANGDRFSRNNPDIVAHKTLPFGTALRITNPKNGRTIVTHVRDRGPFVRGRDLDLSLGAAAALAFRGVGYLLVQILHLPSERAAPVSSRSHPAYRHHHKRSFKRARHRAH